MNVVVRTDSSALIGTGHLVRCLTLAEHLRETGWHVDFVCRDLPGNLIDVLRERGFDVAVLPSPVNSSGRSEIPNESYDDWLGVPWEQDVRETLSAVNARYVRPDWLIVDHYALDRRWEEQLAEHVGALFVIDDLANRPHSCRVLLDHNLNAQGEARYANLVPPNCRLLCGPAYALLRPEFHRVAQGMRERDGRVRRILIFFGGVDATGETLKACEAVMALSGAVLEADVVVGIANPHSEQIRVMCGRDSRFSFHGQVCNMAELMAAADLAIGAGGTTSWERAFLGLPTIVIPVAENQLPGSEALAAAGAVWNLGFHTGITSGEIARVLKAVMADPEEVRRRSRASRQLVDGGGVQRVAAVLAEAISERGKA